MRDLDNVITWSEIDRNDPLAPFRDRFRLPADVIYLDGNSLGPLPITASERIRRAVDEEWSHLLVRGWNDAGWIDLPARVAAKIARLIGADDDCVAVCDSTSINLFKVLSAALKLRQERRVILTDAANFPTDLYVADGLTHHLDRGYEVRSVPFDGIEDALDDSVAAFMLTEVDYRTGRRHDMRKMTALAHARGVLAIWDLAHSAGAFPVHLDAAQADFAVGCGYKYLNGGPGAPAFLFVARRHIGAVRPALAGWMGHVAPFSFDAEFAPAEGIARMTVGTPPILSLVALDAGLDTFEGVDLALVREKSGELCDLFIQAVEAQCPDLELVSPRAAAARGSQVSFRHEEGYAIVQALIAKGVIGDFRSPDILRFGFAPLYVRYADAERAARIIGEVMRERSWDQPQFKKRGKVT